VPQQLDQIPPPEDLPENQEADLDIDLGAELGFLAYRAKLNEVEDLEHELKAKRFMLTMRTVFALLLFGLTLGWLGFIGWVVWLSGLGWAFKRPFLLSDPVLIALITTTTLNVLGLFYGVTQWLFPKLNKDK